jgi:hypothetical protein
LHKDFCSAQYEANGEPAALADDICLSFNTIASSEYDDFTVRFLLLDLGAELLSSATSPSTGRFFAQDGGASPKR